MLWWLISFGRCLSCYQCWAWPRCIARQVTINGAAATTRAPSVVLPSFGSPSRRRPRPLFRWRRAARTRLFPQATRARVVRHALQVRPSVHAPCPRYSTHNRVPASPDDPHIFRISRRCSRWPSCCRDCARKVGRAASTRGPPIRPSPKGVGSERQSSARGFPMWHRAQVRAGLLDAFARATGDNFATWRARARAPSVPSSVPPAIPRARRWPCLAGIVCRRHSRLSQHRLRHRHLLCRVGVSPPTAKNGGTLAAHQRLHPRRLHPRRLRRHHHCRRGRHAART